MLVPDRIIRVVRPSEHPGLLLSTAYGTVVLSISPFVLPAVADHYGLGVGTAALVTASQLAGFVAGSWGAGRFLRARGRVLAVALLVSAAANALSALLPLFALLLAVRAAGGVALGVITWYSWSLVFGDGQRTARIAVVAPLVSVVSVPIASRILQSFDLAGLYVALAALALVPLGFSRRSGRPEPDLLAPRRDGTARHRPTPAATRVLGALGMLTLGGSAVFTFGVVIATSETSLSSDAVAAAYSANALVGIPAARWTGRRGPAGAWIVACSACAVGLGAAPSEAVFVAAVVAWGLFFWLGIPAAFSLLARCSRYPSERAGDAQAIMAAGRVVGPLAGGAVLQSAGHLALGVCGALLMAAAGTVLLLAERDASETPGVDAASRS